MMDWETLGFIVATAVIVLVSITFGYFLGITRNRNE